MTTTNDSTLAPRPTFAPSAAQLEAGALRPAFTPRPAACEHTDRPAWPVSETQLCHECEDRRFRAAMFAIGARAAGFPNAREAAL